jgi:hypothetical protein
MISMKVKPRSVLLMALQARCRYFCGSTGRLLDLNS